METKAQWSKTAPKTVLGRKFITIKSYLKKEEKSQKSKLSPKTRERGTTTTTKN